MSFGFSTLPNNNEHPTIKKLKEQGNKVLERNGKTYVEFDNGEKYEVDLNKPLFMIIFDIDEIKQKAAKKSDIDKWSGIYKEEYTRKTLEIKKRKEAITLCQKLLKDVKNRIHEFFCKHGVDRAEDIENPYERKEAFDLYNESIRLRREISSNRNWIIWLGFSAAGDALKGGEFKLQSVMADQLLA